MTKIKVKPSVRGDNSLDYYKHSDYFEAIIANNYKFIENVFSSKDISDKDRLMNSKFALKQKKAFSSEEVKRGHSAIVYPLHLAVTNQSLDVARVLIKHGADIHQTDDEGRNVLHACVISAVYSPEMEEKIGATLQQFVGELVDRETLRHLLYTEDNPLETIRWSSRVSRKQSS